jgi:hypothetical protein
MVKYITESGMYFIPDNTFHIEKSDPYCKISNKSIRSVEFLRIKDGKLLLIEAKSSFPHPQNLERFHEEIDRILDKFTHSLNLLSSMLVGVAEKDFPDDFDPLGKGKLSLMFVLVINNTAVKCGKVQAALWKALPTYFKKIWKPTLLVIDHETATWRSGLTVRKKKLVKEAAKRSRTQKSLHHNRLTFRS